MATYKEIIRGVFQTFKTTKNFWKAFELYLTQRPQFIHFYNAPSEIMDLPTYTLYRRVLSLGWGIRRKFHEGEIVLYELYKDNRKLIGTERILAVLTEPLEDMYRADFKGKVVLDIGGYLGETMVLFWNWGASKVIVYEPIPENVKFIELNASLNGINAEIHCEGIYFKDEELEVNYDRIDSFYSLVSNAGGSKKIKVKGVSDVISNSNADIAKFDCEGCEQTLLGVGGRILRMIPYYILEYHDNPKQIVGKFLSEGFIVENRIWNVIHCYLRS